MLQMATETAPRGVQSAYPAKLRDREANLSFKRIDCPIQKEKDASLTDIQSAIVEERNNFGDYSVCGDDLKLAAAAAILLYSKSDEAGRLAMMTEAESKRSILNLECPSLGI